jgi:nicotinamide-nucleotide amidase
VRRSGRTTVIRSRILRTWGESESGLNERLDTVVAELDEPGADKPTLAFLASGWEGIKVRLTAGSATAADVDAILDRWEARVRGFVDDVVFGVDDDTMESVVLALLDARGQTLAVAESVTGGLVTGRLTAVPGSSRVLRGGIVSYASGVKFDFLGVTLGPVVNERAAVEMARGVRVRLGASVGLSLTGVAGPDEQDGVAVGTLFVGLVMADGAEHVATYRLPATRDQMRQMSVISALNFLRLQLLAG